MLAGAGMLIAEELADFLKEDSPQSFFALVTDEELANKQRLDTGWPCGEAERPCSHILINKSDSLLCVPTENKDGFLMVTLEHFRLIAGCGLDYGGDGKPRLVKYDQVYLLEAGSPLLTCGEKSWTFPVMPYEAHGFTYVPLRFLCETLDLEIIWREACEVVMLRSLWVDAGAIAAPVSAVNQTLLAALEKEEWPYGEDPVELTATFYYSSKDPVYTASGEQAEAGTIAADGSIPFGTRFYIPELDYIREDGIFTVQDRGSAIKGNTIDVFLPNPARKDKEVKNALNRGRFAVTGYMIPPAE
jgi:3D (Asp-Asp-Asp) domain-containing protein